MANHLCAFLEEQCFSRQPCRVFSSVSFSGICASLITLVTAELIDEKYGIGWYINWQRAMLSYTSIYAGLIIAALTFSLLVTGLFKIRGRFLGWQVVSSIPPLDQAFYKSPLPTNSSAKR